MKDELGPLSVIGLGLIGGSLCQAFKKKGLTVYGVSGGETIEKALQMNAVDEGFGYERMAEAVERSRTVFICTPLLDIEKTLPEVFRHSQKHTIVSDVGSTKAVICEVARRYLAGSRGHPARGHLAGPHRHLAGPHRHLAGPHRHLAGLRHADRGGPAGRPATRGVHFIGGHPMAGSEKSGIDNANPYLFYDAVYVLTPLPGTPKQVTRRLSSLVTMLGAKVMILSPELHDRIAADVSHLPHLLAVLLTNQLGDRESDLFRNLAAGGFRDMTRIASSSFSVWKDIIGTNTVEVKRSLQDFRGRLELLLERLGDEEYLKDLFDRANRERKTIPKYSKGFLTPLFDVRVAVKDRPGELAKITNTAYYRGVNIKDIEIVNIREGEGGVLRLGFVGKDEARTVADALVELGYEVTVQE